MLTYKRYVLRLSVTLLLSLYFAFSCADTRNLSVNNEGKPRSVTVMETVRGNGDTQEDLGTDGPDMGPGSSEPTCVVWDNALGCITDQTYSQSELSNALDQIYEVLGSTELIGNRESCSVELAKQSDVLSSQRYINTLRRLNNIEPITLQSELKYSECAFIEDANASGGTWRGSRCFDANFAQALAVDTEKMSGRWSVYDNLYQNVSSSRTNGIELRHKLLDPVLSELSVGQHYGQSCLGLNKQEFTSPTPFTVFPGLGQVPFEFVNSGNNESAKVPWSIKLIDELAEILNVDVYLIEGEDHRPVEIDLFYPVYRHNNQSDRSLVAWHLSQPPFASAHYKVVVFWQTGTQDQRESEFSISFDDYGSVMPERCDPAQINQCKIPGYDCLNGPLNGTIGWYCVSGGPMGDRGDCSEYDYPCKSGFTCLHSFQGSLCREYCIRETEEPRSCRSICARSSVAGTQTDVKLGYCL